jgi:hypothetical protein
MPRDTVVRPSLCADIAGITLHAPMRLRRTTAIA